jgi:hypothetical protein
MASFRLRVFGAASLMAIAACTTRTDTIPPSTAPALAPGTPAVAAAPVIAAPGTVIPAPPATAVPATPGAHATATVPGSGTSTMPLAAPDRISPTDTAGIVSGNTVTGIASDGQPYYAWFAPNGQLRFRQGTFIDAGTWRIGPDGRFCTAMTKINGGIEECYLLYRTTTPTAIRFDRLDGTTAGTFSVLPGNPQAL